MGLGWFKRTRADFEGDKYSFSHDLLRLRARYDGRINVREIEDWPFSKAYCDTVDGMLVDVLIKYSRLKSFDLSDTNIWDRIDSVRGRFGFPCLTAKCDFFEYITARIALEDEGYLRLPQSFVDGQIALAKEYGAKQLASVSNWPPQDFLLRQLTTLEVERLGLGEIPAITGSPASFSRSRNAFIEDLAELKMPMLREDELWTFSNSSNAWKQLAGVAGLALVRDGRSIASIITVRN